MAIRIIREVIAEHPLVSTQPGMSVREACRLMVDKHIGALLVLEGKRIVGIFTERNALTRTGISGESDAKMYVKPKGSSGVIDPIDQRQSIGFKINSVGFGSTRLEAVVDYICIPTMAN